MIHHLLASIAHGIIAFISYFGYAGIVLLMLIESACIPLPSEIIMPFSGYLAGAGRFNLAAVTFCGAFGNLLGSLLIYFLVRNRGFAFLEKNGKYFLLNLHHLKQAERFFARFGDLSVLAGRMLPIVRTFISLPAGIMRVRLPLFCVLTFTGSVPWCFALAYTGMILGRNWEKLQPIFHRIDTPVFLALSAGIVLWWWRNRD